MYKGDNWGTAAYIVSPQGARKLLKNVYPLETQIDKHIIEIVERGWRKEEEESKSSFVAYVVEPPMVREWKSLHVSDIQRDE